MFPELYHAHHSIHTEDLPFWLELAAQVGDPILELGCGTGRVLVPLAQAGHGCIGLDNDLGMLRFLGHNLDQKLAGKIALVTADITQFTLAEQFSLIILPCNTYSTLDTLKRQACLACVYQHLHPGGTFAVSVPNPQVLERLPAISDAEFEDEFLNPYTGNPVQVSSSWRRKKDTFVVTWDYDQLFPDGTVDRLKVEVTHQRMQTQAYLDEIQTAGLNVQHIFGDFDRSGYSADSPNLIILAAA